MISAIAAATTATIVDTANNWVYISFITAVKVVQMLPVVGVAGVVGAAAAGYIKRTNNITIAIMVQQ